MAAEVAVRSLECNTYDMTHPEAGSPIVMVTRTTKYPDGSQEVAIYDLSNRFKLPLLEVFLGEPVSVVLVSAQQATDAEVAMGPYVKIDKE
jgi:hypothetical protein